MERIGPGQVHWRKPRYSFIAIGLLLLSKPRVTGRKQFRRLVAEERTLRGSTQVRDGSGCIVPGNGHHAQVVECPWITWIQRQFFEEKLRCLIAFVVVDQG